MTTPVVTVGPDATFADLVDQLLANAISGLPVVDADGQLLGMVTEADLVSKEAYGYRRRRALGLVAGYHPKRLPPVEDGRVVGIVSRHDLLHPFHRAGAAVLADVERLLDDVLRVPETHEVRPSVTAGVVTLDGTAQCLSDVAHIEAVVAARRSGLPALFVADESRPPLQEAVS